MHMYIGNRLGADVFTSMRGIRPSS